LLQYLLSADDLRGVMGVGCSDVLAVRLWLDQKLNLRSASNVAAGFDDGVGGTFFQLDKLQVGALFCYFVMLRVVSVVTVLFCLLCARQQFDGRLW
jgi:hypothetical protein